MKFGGVVFFHYLCSEKKTRNEGRLRGGELARDEEEGGTGGRSPIKGKKVKK